MATLFDDQEPPRRDGAAEAGRRPASAVGSGDFGGDANAPALAAGTPLAERCRPRTLDEVVGQQKVVGPRGFLRQAIAADRVPSLLFWGPPGVGKTTLARLIATATRLQFVPFSAVTSGIKEIKEVMAEATRLRRATGRRSLLFVDEIHRFNRAQQDAFLPYIERGDIVLVGATTENPSFELNAALLSRCQVVVLEPLAVDEVVTLLSRVLADRDRGLGGRGVEVTAEALAEIAQLSSGDARRALNLLEAVVDDARVPIGRDPKAPSAQTATTTTDAVASAVVVDVARLREVAQRKTLVYDKSGEEHFNLISALHKSLRESDPDAALYWLARMLEAGDDPHYLARRLVRFAVEDVGLADPSALTQGVAAWEAYHRLGSPEGDLALAQLVVYLALAPKSIGVYRAWSAARKLVAERPAEPVPAVIRNAPTRLMGDLGYGKGYVYAPDTAEGVAGLDLLPESLAGTELYQPSRNGAEVELGERLARYRALRERVRKGERP